ncbi:hypothetical protein TKK_0003595 [Trichogramma kaykai]|uniref:Major facilitator superfamily (MFS) profile domain-containing protein n=1 Tax=Trichogramma kaykai TaxID=54128 RepID=A0ABD2XQ21_9HYME
MSQFTQKQWFTLIVICVANFANAICVSLQAPFYPAEAEKKGATATEYGLVFGIFELVVFLVSPFYGKNMNKFGPKLMLNGGILTTGTCVILFGFLDRIDGREPFILLSLIIRIIEALGNAAFVTSSFAIIAKEFPDNVATAFASIETCFGLGLIVGPTIGGGLFQIGGFTTPFAVLGFVLFAVAVITIFVLPVNNGLQETDFNTKGKLMKVLGIPGVMLAATSVVATSMSIGFLQATLEPHLHQFKLTPVQVGLMFVINGGTYALSAPAWGWLCDKRAKPKAATVVGCLLVVIGFGLIGPVPFIFKKTILWLTITGLTLHGLGMAAQLVAGFSDALQTAMDHGFPNDIETYGLISGLWTSTFALGAFIGPTIAGILCDNVGFRYASILICALHLIVGIITSIFIYCKRRESKLYKELGITDRLFTDRNRSSRLRNAQEADIQIISVKPQGSINSLVLCGSYSNQSNGWMRISNSNRFGYESF